MAEEEQEGAGFDISWRHTKHRRRLTIKHGDATLIISHAKTEQAARDLTLAVNVLPQILVQVSDHIQRMENPADDIET